MEERRLSPRIGGFHGGTRLPAQLASSSPDTLRLSRRLKHRIAPRTHTVLPLRGPVVRATCTTNTGELAILPYGLHCPLVAAAMAYFASRVRPIHRERIVRSDLPRPAGIRSILFQLLQPKNFWIACKRPRDPPDDCFPESPSAGYKLRALLAAGYIR